MKNHFLISFIFLLCISQSWSQCNIGNELITNGSFEMPDVAQFDTYNQGETFSGWTVTAGNVDQLDQDVDMMAPGDWANNGLQSMDMNGNMPGSISQEISTEEDKVYEISFFLSSNDYCNSPPTGHPTALILIINGITIDIYDAPANGTWTQYSANFVGPAGPVTTIEFISNNQYQSLTLTPSGCGALLDDVSVFECDNVAPPDHVVCGSYEGGNLITNPSFENDVVLSTEGTKPFGPGEMDGWTIVGDVDLTNQIHFPPLFPQFPGQWAIDGDQGIDLNVTSSSSISQKIATVPNNVYELSFYVSSNIYCSNPRHGFTDGLEVQVDGLGIGTYDTPSNPIWLQQSILFTSGPGDSTDVAFVSLTGNIGCGPLLDDISVTRCGFPNNIIPTLSQWAIIALGLLIVIFGALSIKSRSLPFFSHE